MDLIQKELLEEIAGLHEVPAGAYNIRANGKAYQEIQLLILILFLKKISRIDIIIKPGTKKRKCAHSRCNQSDWIK